MIPHIPFTDGSQSKESQKHVQVTFNPKIIGGKNIIIITYLINIIIYYIFIKDLYS